MGSKIGFEMSLIIVEAIRGRCASFMILVATVSEIFGGQTTPSILVKCDDRSCRAFSDFKCDGRVSLVCRYV